MPWQPKGRCGRLGLRKWYENGRRASKNELFLIFFEGAQADEGKDEKENGDSMKTGMKRRMKKQNQNK